MFTASTAGGYARLVFALKPAGHIGAQVSGQILTITFDHKVSIAPSEIAQALPGYIDSGHADADGKTFRFALNQAVRVHISTSAGKSAVDLAPASFSGTPPDLPQPPPPPPTAVDVSKLEILKVRSGAYQNFTRIVFDWGRNVPYAVFPGSGKLTIRFEAQVNPDFSAITRQAPPWVKTAGWRIENKGTIVELETDTASGFHDFRDGTHVVVDVLAPKTDADAYNPPGDTKPSVTKFTPVTKSANAITTAQAQAIAATASKLNPQTTKPVAPVAKPPQAPAAAPAAPAATAAAVATQAANPSGAVPNSAATALGNPATPPTQETQEADSRLLKDGVVLTFPGAGRHNAAVFIRGTTAWIVLEGAPPLDAPRLKAQLGQFPEAVDASSNNGVAVLRLTLKQPEHISAAAEGSNLKIVIASQANSNAIALDYSRNQDDATHTSLTSLLPGADRAVTLVDPLVGDELYVIPGLPGRAMTNERNYLEFAALQTASGMALLPYVDDLITTIDTTRVTITRKGGLSLAAPSMPLTNSSQIGAAGSEGPCFLDFARWSRISGGSFLVTERRLRAATARLKSEDANHARLVLARFYIANGFAAEALGLVNIMQSTDPALQSDMQLQTIRAAADFFMGRYRDAHNDLAALPFDTDRHAALWRGLSEAALENWDLARTYLDRAAPVLNRYQADMQARVRVASASTALAQGQLDIADAQLARLPAQQVARPLMLDAELARARLFAMERRTHDADALFAAIERSGDERVAAKAIFYRLDTALTARTISAAAGINALERLRFRWRGDLLELKTLRKLAGLYFSQKRWREGLQTLRIATQNFPNDDMAGRAQDDMRAAFVDLYLHGKADSMPPVEALALFYDFIELTPIGPDGDEMIRRMSDRLVAVDLLGPAADLLNYQVTKRLDGVARAQVATRLAMVQLMDHKPQMAIETLRSTRLSTLPDDVNHQRLLMEARALADEKQWDQALDLIAVDQLPDTNRLRSDIYWQSGNWPAAARKAEESLATRFSDTTPLTVDERQEVMRAAVAYSLANDETSLERLRNNYAAKMKTSPDANAFTVVTQRIDMHGLAFRNAAAQVASVDTLQTFMKNLHDHRTTAD
ncbi:MAG: hypothetical protein WCA81_16765 [Rhizomicrobium sp.]